MNTYRYAPVPSALPAEPIEPDRVVASEAPSVVDLTTELCEDLVRRLREDLANKVSPLKSYEKHLKDTFPTLKPEFFTHCFVFAENRSAFILAFLAFNYLTDRLEGIVSYNHELFKHLEHNNAKCQLVGVETPKDTSPQLCMATKLKKQKYPPLWAMFVYVIETSTDFRVSLNIGKQQLLQHDEARAAFQNGRINLTFEVEFEVYIPFSTVNPTIVDEYHNSPMDLYFCVGHKVIPVHKDVITSLSCVIFAMFAKDFRERQSNKVPVKLFDL
uniref:BTB domain-containing protein n=1 Tax=Panagrellus redivivus TaxID=6233 RepID=A0A7E4VMM8_PANRE